MKFHRSFLLGTTALTFSAVLGAVALAPLEAFAACQTVNSGDDQQFDLLYHLG
jgi:hypothetical protein